MSDTVEILVDNEDGVLSAADVIVRLTVELYNRLLEQASHEKADRVLQEIARQFEEDKPESGLPEWMATARIRYAAETATRGTFFEETDWMQDVLTAAIELTFNGEGFIDYLPDHPGVLAIFH